MKNITSRAVRLALNQNKYEYKVENIRGGKTYKIKLSTLEEELQLKYFQEYYDDYKTCENEVIELSNLNIKQEKLISENQRKIALAKYDLIYVWLNFRKEYKRDKLKTGGNIPDKEFLQLYNTGMFQEEIFKILCKVSIGSLYRWRALLDYNKDWTALVGQYKYSTRKEYRTTLNEEQIKIFIQILLSPSSFSIGKAISLTKHILKERGQEILPKDITFRRYAEWFRDNNFDKWTLARDGEKALKDKVSPFIVRNAALLKPGQVLVADGHTLPKQPEIARLAESFNIMKHSMAQQMTTLQEKNEIERELHRQKTEALELQNRMERSRLQQLRSQIDPHFLFNTLNVIQQTAGTETAYRTQALIMALSHLLRYSLMSNDEQVPLSREVRIVDEYYSIYHVRFGERVRMEWRISDLLDLTETMVPSFILQPVVENAFKHGICPKEEGGVVRIRINPLRDKGLLYISVCDNGVGIQPQQLAQLKAALARPGERWEHIGIYNVAARLRLLDRNSRFVIRSHPGRLSGSANPTAAHIQPCSARSPHP